jgi:hypothetical protein
MVRAVLSARFLDRVLTLAREVAEPLLRLFLLPRGNLTAPDGTIWFISVFTGLE